jgi:hypothetical protein
MKFVYFLSIIILFSCNLIEDKTDTQFTKEIAEAKKGWGKDTLRVQTMYGFKLRMSKEEYEKHYDSLIKVGILDKNGNIEFNGDAQSISVNPTFFSNQLFKIDFSLSPFYHLIDTNFVPLNKTESNMLDLIQKLYGKSKLYKEYIMYYTDDKSKIFSKDWAYGWIENNRLINVSRSFMPSVEKEEDWRYKTAEFIDLELREKFDLNKKKVDSISAKKEAEDKDKKVFK